MLYFLLLTTVSLAHSFDEFDKEFDLLDGDERISIIEKHEPKYRIETKVAAPVYILPNHGPTINQQQQQSQRLTPIVIKAGDVIVKPPTTYKIDAKNREQQQPANDLKQTNQTRPLKQLVELKLQRSSLKPRPNLLKLQSLLNEPQVRIIRHHHHYFYEDFHGQQQHPYSHRTTIATIIQQQPVAVTRPANDFYKQVQMPYSLHQHFHNRFITGREIERIAEAYVEQKQNYVARQIPYCSLCRQYHFPPCSGYQVSNPANFYKVNLSNLL